MPLLRIAVIGGVAAGPAAAAQAKRTAPKAEVVLFEQGPHISYGACEIPYYVADAIPRLETLIQHTPASLESTRGVQVRVKHRVEALHPKRRRIVVRRLEDGMVEEERFDKVILAVGARAKTLGIEGEQAANVHLVRTLEDAAWLKQSLEAGNVRHAVIIGGGYVGVEMAEALVLRGIRTTMLAASGRVMANNLTPTITAPLQEAMHARGVIIRDEQAVRFHQQSNGRVDYIETAKGERIGCQLVLVAAGIAPNTDLAASAGLKLGRSGAFRVDDGMRTNLPNIWACGDCAEVTRLIDRKPIFWPLAATGYRTAHVAGANAARQGRGRPARFDGVLGITAMKAFGIEVASIGLTLNEALAAGYDAIAVDTSHWSRVAFYPGAQPLFMRFVAERSRGRLLGAQASGAEGAALRINVLSPILKAAGMVKDVHALELAYTPPIAPLHDPLRVTASHMLEKLAQRG